uniref:BTB domain-containing protein n=1 Tax=Panagrolaimus davidi TaxID=227884 RepID=A0A914PB98_9BILA
MLEYPIALEWKISQRQLLNFKNSTNNGYFSSTKYTAIHSSNVKYYLRIFPNGDNNERRGQTWIFLYLELGSEKRVEAEYTISVKSAYLHLNFNYVYGGKFPGWGSCLCKPDDLFVNNSPFLINGELCLKLEGTLKVKKAESLLGIHGMNGLWDQDYKDFTIVVKNIHKIEVHKNVLACRSPVFAAMFKSFWKEAVESKVDIPDFSYDIVEKAVKLCYDYKLVDEISIEEGIEIYAFADKYDIEVVRDFVELYLGDNLTATNFCEIVDFAISVNASKLKNKCMDFLIYCFFKKIDVAKIEEIDKDFVAEARKNLFCHFCETL